MSKMRQSNKEPKKQPHLTPKEKKAVKQVKLAKKQGPDVSRLIPRGAGGATSKVGLF